MPKYTNDPKIKVYVAKELKWKPKPRVPRTLQSVEIAVENSSKPHF